MDKEPDNFYVIPASGVRVVNPKNRQPLPAEGDTVERNTHWLRRIADGDVTEGKAPRAQAAAAKARE